MQIWSRYRTSFNTLRDIAADIVALVSTAGADAVKLLASSIKVNRRLTVLFGFEHDANVVVGGAYAEIKNRFPDPRGHGQQFIAAAATRNLSETHVINRLHQARFPVQRCGVTRADSRYLTLRTAGLVPREVRGVHVGVIGCGALGGSLALRLAQSGVRKLTLIDADVLKIENVGRHELGASHIGRHKTEGLRIEILGRYCDYRVKSVPKNWQAAFEESRTVLEECDLLVAATGDWLSNAQLNAIALELEVSVVYCWLERFALAGHGLFVTPGGACLRCVNDEFGAFEFQVSRIGGDLPTDPSCGAHYQPFSAYASNQAASMMTKLVLDVVEGRVQNSHLRSWVASHDEFDRVGAGIDDGWHNTLFVEGKFEAVSRRDLSIRQTCPTRHGG